MKCPNCGQWNQAAFPRCYQCGMDLPQPEQDSPLSAPSWQEGLRNAEPSETFIQFGEDADVRILPSKQIQQELIGREVDHLKERRERGAFQLASIRQQARKARESIANAAILKPTDEEDPYEALLSARTIKDLDEEARVPERKRHATGSMSATKPSVSAKRKRRGGHASPSVVLEPIEMPSVEAANADWRGQTAAAWKTQGEFIYTEDERAPVLYDGYTPSPTDKSFGARGMDPDPMIAEREKATWTASRHSAIATTFERGKHQTMVPKSVPKRKPKKRRHSNVMFVQWLAILATAGVVVAGIIIGMPRLLKYLTPADIQAETTESATWEESVLDGHPAHTIWIRGKENTTIYIKELQKSYVVTAGYAQVQVPDYFWYENSDKDLDATEAVTMTPVIRYPAGDEEQLKPIIFPISIPESNVRLIRPESLTADVNTSLVDLRMQVDRGSRVVINKEDVSDLIDANGRISKSVHVQAIGENYVEVSVRSPKCRPYNFEIVLRRAPQAVFLEMSPDTLSETEGTADEEFLEETERLAAYAELMKKKKTAQKKPQMKLFARTEPGASIEILSPYIEGSLDDSQLAIDGTFSFIATFYKPETNEVKIGDNEVKIRSTFNGKETEITHIVNYVPPEDVYTKKAWKFERSDYLDLINNIELRKGQVYVCKGKIKEIISEHPQLAVMDTDPTESEQLVLLENSSRTKWEVNRYYNVYGEAFGLYEVMPRITIRYTYPY